MCSVLPRTFNRPIVELKWELIITMYLQLFTFNRPIVELKFLNPLHLLRHLYF